jgi:hypothetical protein
MKPENLSRLIGGISLYRLLKTSKKLEKVQRDTTRYSFCQRAGFSEGPPQSCPEASRRKGRRCALMSRAYEGVREHDKAENAPGGIFQRVEIGRLAIMETVEW